MTNYAYTRFFHPGFLLGWSCLCSPLSVGVPPGSCHCGLGVRPVGPVRGSLCKDIGALLRRYPLADWDPGAPSEDTPAVVAPCPPPSESGCVLPLGCTPKKCEPAPFVCALPCDWESSLVGGVDLVGDHGSGLINPLRSKGAEQSREVRSEGGVKDGALGADRRVRDLKQKKRFAGRFSQSIRRGTPFTVAMQDACKLTSNSQNRSKRNKFDCLSAEEPLEGFGTCTLAGRLAEKARRLVPFFEGEFGIKRVSSPPSHVRCGGLRSAVRDCFPSELTGIQMLSLKSVAAIERWCKACSDPAGEELIKNWKKAISTEAEVCPDHLAAFKKAIAVNVDRGWNTRRRPYVPNGRGTYRFRRHEGGNWNREEFSTSCRVIPVVSKGKMRVVTAYSGYNSRVLTPLHDSLYGQLRRWGWLLTGDPNPDLVAGLNGDGDFLSFDYVSATDSIKTAYTRAAIEVLIEKSVGLDPDEERCMQVLGSLVLDSGPPTPRGQPMGSPLSFPVLCLINKAVVDLSLLDLLDSGVIGYDQYITHRCLINGDDLLVKEPGKKTSLYDRIVYHGSAVGLVVNKEKSLVSGNQAEINSTLFTGLKEEKKINARALYMNPEEADVLGFARRSTCSRDGFVKAVVANTRQLARQVDKGLWRLPYSYQRECRKNRKIRRALLSEPVVLRQPLANLFPVVPKPVGYNLSKEEERCVINNRVDVLTDSGEGASVFSDRRLRRPGGSKPSGCSWRSLLRNKKKPDEEVTLLILSQAYTTKEKDRLVQEGTSQVPAEDGWFDFHDESIFPSRVEHLLAGIRSRKTQKRVRVDHCWSRFVHL